LLRNVVQGELRQGRQFVLNSRAVFRRSEGGGEAVTGAGIEQIDTVWSVPLTVLLEAKRRAPAHRKQRVVRAM
jgi:hypothetical protein